MIPIGARARRYRYRLLAALAAIGILPSPAQAHLNSPDVFLEESIGPYPAVIIVHMPPAIPGEASVQVRFKDLANGERVLVQTRDVPAEGAAYSPEWRTATVSDVDPSFFTSYMPLMIPGLWHSEIRVQGSRGEGSTSVPVSARLMNPARMGPGLAVLLVILMAVFFTVSWQISYDVGRDAHLPPGRPPTPRDVRRGRMFGSWGLSLFTLWLIFLGWTWFLIDYKHRVHAIPPMRSNLSILNGPAVQGRPLSMRLELLSTGQRPDPQSMGQPLDVVPDHGKMMHTAVFRLPDFSCFMHLHPRMTSPGVFEFEITPPEAGIYKLFADVLHSSGDGETVTNTLVVAPGEEPRGEPTPGDPDDSWSSQPPLGSPATQLPQYRLSDDLAIRWEHSGTTPVRRGEFQILTFEVVRSDGTPVEALDPYMGMAGHLMIVRDDGQVFAHIHPMGTLGGRMAMMMGDGTTHGAMGGAGMVMGNEKLPARVTFPFGFPQSGRYRMFVQVKVAQQVRTGVFDLRVD